MFESQCPHFPLYMYISLQKWIPTVEYHQSPQPFHDTLKLKFHTTNKLFGLLFKPQLAPKTTELKIKVNVLSITPHSAQHFCFDINSV